MSVEVVLIEYRVVVGQRLGQPRQPRRRYLLQRRLVRLVPDATHVDRHSVLGVVHRRFGISSPLTSHLAGYYTAAPNTNTKWSKTRILYACLCLITLRQRATMKFIRQETLTRKH